MDPMRFDALARWLGRGTRRSVLQAVAGTTLGVALLGHAEPEDAAAKKKCVKPGKKCKKKGKKLKCCGTATCSGKRCVDNAPEPGPEPGPGGCPADAPLACGATCCKPGQVCQGGTTCVNGNLEPGDFCNPEEPSACETGNCQCISDGIITQCTCRQEACFGFGVACTNTVQCCTGGCEGFTLTCLPIEP